MKASLHLSDHRLFHSMSLLIIALLVCIQGCAHAGAAPVTASISPGPSAALPIPAADFEREGMGLMAAHDYGTLISLTDQGLAIYPGDAELMCLKAYALRKTGHFQESIDLLNAAILLDPRPARYANRGYGYLAMGKADKALADADAAILYNNSYSQGHGLKAEALLSLGNFTGALGEADTAIMLDPGSAHYWHVRGNVLDRMNDCEGAIESLRHSVTLSSDYDMPWPGLPNASEDLARVKSTCGTTGASPSPTQAALPVMLTIAAAGIAVGMRRT